LRSLTSRRRLKRFWADWPSPEGLGLLLLYPKSLEGGSLLFAYRLFLKKACTGTTGTLLWIGINNFVRMITQAEAGLLKTCLQKTRLLG